MNKSITIDGKIHKAVKEASDDLGISIKHFTEQAIKHHIKRLHANQKKKK